MTNVSFVETLDLASDDRLRGLRPDFGARPEIGVTRGGGQRAPEAVGKNLRAAVNAGAVVSFVAGLTEGEVNDVLFSTNSPSEPRAQSTIVSPRRKHGIMSIQTSLHASDGSERPLPSPSAPSRPVPTRWTNRRST
jgi:hypothetical protein